MIEIKDGQMFANKSCVNAGGNVVKPFSHKQRKSHLLNHSKGLSNDENYLKHLYTATSKRESNFVKFLNRKRVPPKSHNC